MANLIDKKDLGILLIDMQEFFLQFIYPAEKRESLVRNQLEVLKYSRRNSLPIFLVEFGGYGKTIHPLMNEITKKYREPIMKRKQNGFIKTNLDAKLEEANVNNLLFMGIYKGACVKQTAEEARNKGYQILTSGDLVGSSSPKVEKESTPWFKEKGIYRASHKDLLQLIY